MAGDLLLGRLASCTPCIHPLKPHLYAASTAAAACCTCCPCSMGVERGGGKVSGFRPDGRPPHTLAHLPASPGWWAASCPQRWRPPQLRGPRRPRGARFRRHGVWPQGGSAPTAPTGRAVWTPCGCGRQAEGGRSAAAAAAGWVGLRGCVRREYVAAMPGDEDSTQKCPGHCPVAGDAQGVGTGAAGGPVNRPLGMGPGPHTRPSAPGPLAARATRPV
jgi:hypothetical protein